MPSRLQYRRAVGGLHGLHQVAVNTVAATGGDLVTAGWPIRSQSNQRGLFEGYFLYRPLTDETRMVKTPGGYDPTNGRLTPDDPFASGLGIGEEIEVWGVLDPSVVNDLINDVLKLCLMTEDVVVPALNQTARYDLTAVAPWLKSESWVRQVGWLGVNEVRADYPDLYDRRSLRGEVKKIGNRIYWSGTYYSQDQDLYFLCVKRHYDHCRADALGVFGEQSGLDTDDAECEADPDWVAAGVMMRAWQQYKRVLDQAANPKVQNGQVEMAQLFSSLEADNFELPDRTVRALPRLWGPPRR